MTSTPATTKPSRGTAERSTRGSRRDAPPARRGRFRTGALLGLIAGVGGGLWIAAVDDRRRRADPGAGPLLREAADRLADAGEALVERAGEAALGTADGAERILAAVASTAGSMRHALAEDDRAGTAPVLN